MTTPDRPGPSAEQGPAGPPPGWAPPPVPPQGQGYGQPGYGPPPGWTGQPPQGWSQAGAGPQSSDDTTWALLAHLSFFVLGLIGPLVIYLVKKDSSPFVRQHAAEALNFHITVLFASIVSLVLMLVIIGFFTLLAVVVAGMVLSVVAAVAANKGEPYRYPLTIRLVS